MSDRDSFNRFRGSLMDLYEAGDYTTALELVEENEADFPDMSARVTFWKMCLLSLAGCLDDALSTFRQGLASGMWWAESQFNDTDLDPLRDLPEFVNLVAESRQRYNRERQLIERDRILLLPDTPHSEPFPLLVVLHGRSGNEESDLAYWDVARREGWGILSPRSRQPLFPGSYCWDNPVAGLEEILFHLEGVLKKHKINRERIVIGGFSQGSGMALYTALQPGTPICGFIGVGTWWPDIDSIAALAQSGKQVRSYFITGEGDHTLERAREIQSTLSAHGIVCTEEVHPDLGHEFPSEFERSLKRALEVIFEE
jgi:predicted esterase